MEQVIPWAELKSLIEPHYPKEGNGRPPVGLSIMLRIYFCSTGSTYPILRPKRRCMIRPHCAGLPESIWAARRRRTRRRS
jgi:hypothetical protein